MTWASALMMAAALVSGSVAEMKHHRRVLIVAAPDEADASLAAERGQLAGWQAGATDRDLTIVEVIGDRVTGSSDPAKGLRTRYRLPAAHFEAVLVGKDGHVALRTRQPIASDTLGATIDAMPMRKAGLR